MTASVLDALRQELLKIAPADVHRPTIPPHVYFQEAHDVLTWIEQSGALAKLTAVGLPVDTVPVAVKRLAAAREAQALWAAVRSPRKPEQQKDLEDHGIQLRSDIVAAARWNLRDSRVAMGALDRIVEGTGVPDLTQDLTDLAQLVEQNAGGFAQDQTFDPAAVSAQARQLALDIRSGLSEYRTDTAMADAVDLRNRAYTLLDEALSDIRAAGQYAFRGQPDSRRFTSTWERNRRRQQRRGQADAPAGAAPPATA